MSLYDKLLEELNPLVKPVFRSPYCSPSWHLYQILVDFDELGFDRNFLIKRLRDLGIGTQVHYIPVHKQPYFEKIYGKISLPGSESFYQKTLSLPLFSGMGNDQVLEIVDGLKQVINEYVK